MISNRFRSLLSFNKLFCASKRWTTATATKVSDVRICKKPIKKSLYAYKRSQTTYYDWMEAVNRVDIKHSDFHRPLIIRMSVRQILRYMHDGYIDKEEWTTFRDYLVKKDIGVSRLFDGIFLQECLGYQRFLMGLSYISYLQHEEISLTPTSLAMLLLCAREIDIRQDFSEYRLDEQIILNAYDEFLSHKIVPDTTLALPIIAGLTLTSRWKDALQYLPILDNDLDGMQQALGFVLTAAAKFHDYAFFFSLLDTISQTEAIRLREERQRIRADSKQKNSFESKKNTAADPRVRRPIAPSSIKESDYYLISKTSQAYETFTEYLTGDRNTQIETLVKLLDKTASNGYIPPVSFVKALEKKLRELDPNRYKCEHIYFYPNGTSLDNKSILPSIEPSEQECQVIHSWVRSKFQSLLESSCPKLATDPSKLLHQLSEPFDVLFDCYHYPTLELDWHVRHPLYVKRIIYQIAEEKGKRCVVIAKIDLADYIDSLRMPPDLVSVVRVPYESIKSPLPLLSALYMNPTALLASPVDQRIYKTLLGLNNIDVMDRWIQTHQLVPIAKPDLVYLQAPCLYSTRVHIDTNEWLIPYFDGSPLTEAENVQTCKYYPINTVLKQENSGNGDAADSDVANISCLSNELILSERMTKFPFHYRCVLEQQLAICPDRCVSNDEWKDLYNIVGEPVKPLFGSITMLICVQLKHIERGRSLFRFIQEYHPQLLTSSSTTYSTYMSLLALDYFTLKNKKHGQDYSVYEKEIYDIYQNYVKDKNQSIIASTAALGIIKGLSVTRYWHEAYLYLRFVRDDDQIPAIRELILAALHNDDVQSAIKLLDNLNVPLPSDSAAATLSTSLTEMVRDVFRNLNENNPNTSEFIERLFQYLSTLDYFMEKSAIEEMQMFFDKFKGKAYQYGTTMVYPNGTCKQLSGVSLKSSELSNDDFHFLQNYLMESAYTDKEVFNTTTPTEFKRFQRFLSQHKFTMIIDGLNILYGIGRFATDPVTSMIKTINFLKNLNVNRKQMLFIARKHVTSRIPADIQENLRSICEIFLVDNTSRDDWFVLYAALHSKAYVLTSDILRKERGIANKSTPAKNTEVNDKLQKWLYRYQYMFLRQGKRLYFKQPLAYKLRAQCTQNTWLIPYFNEKPLSLAQRPDKWFYVYKNSDKPLKRNPIRKATIIDDEKKSV
ncbi:unnamed protein product [Adineta ricciae]|uniref:PRORP domain-containing protein n=1 Tax=Adineta ricciae TaxID=249248 RepID=A0A813Y6V5_ADIRI|nr:unnamed protein product [Adineta ricciae]